MDAGAAQPTSSDQIILSQLKHEGTLHSRVSHQDMHVRNPQMKISTRQYPPLHPSVEPVAAISTSCQLKVMIGHANEISTSALFSTLVVRCFDRNKYNSTLPEVVHSTPQG